MAEMANEKLQKIQEFLDEKFGVEVGTFRQLMCFPQQESNESQGETLVINFLYDLIENRNVVIIGDMIDVLIEEYLKNVVEGTREASNNDEYKNVLDDICNGDNTARAHSQLPQNLLDKIRNQRILTVDNSIKYFAAYVGLLSHVTTGLSKIPNEDIPQVIEALEGNKVSKALMPLVITSASFTQAASVTLIAVQLCLVFLKNIRLWWKREITGKFCAKNIVDAIGSIFGGAACAAAVAAAGSSLGPVGSFIGGIIGGIAGSYAGESLTGKLTEWMFDLPENSALEAAYNFLGVHHKADNSKCNEAFNTMVLQCHPNRPEGTVERWLKLQISIQVIKEARGQSF